VRKLWEINLIRVFHTLPLTYKCLFKHNILMFFEKVVHVLVSSFTISQKILSTNKLRTVRQSLKLQKVLISFNVKVWLCFLFGTFLVNGALSVAPQTLSLSMFGLLSLCCLHLCSMMLQIYNSSKYWIYHCHWFYMHSLSEMGSHGLDVDFEVQLVTVFDFSLTSVLLL
jgi:hypothetical protein